MEKGFQTPVKQAEFIIGAAAAKQFPQEPLAEVAFAGRSNVGKSSLMNKLLNRRKLVRVSGTPGCTREVNFFLINRHWWFVDLPGYGYAKVRRDQYELWNRTIGDYLSGRPQLRAVLMLIDIRRSLLDADLEMIALMESLGIGWVPVVTKADKLKSNPRRVALKKITEKIQTIERHAICKPIAVSAHSGEGMKVLWNQLLCILDPEHV
ncbi:MAG: YihA family ribosome biogenesis GTP-binding protein [Magnetococcales bacterium]|nr:YihA family ribosome biogenesis GTP-binding protein [Magnetococcales bacterium]